MVRRQLASLSWLGSVSELTSDSLVRGFCGSGKPSPSLLPPVVQNDSDSGYLVGHRAPEEAGQLAADCGDSHLRALAPQHQVKILATKATSGAVGAGESYPPW